MHSTPSTYANYRVAEHNYLPNLKPFRGNTLSAYWTHDYPPTYKVYSYNALIATYSANNPNGGWQLHTPHRGSKTTTRHQNILQRVTGLTYDNN